jgi:organic radical activating enzyme
MSICKNDDIHDHLIRKSREIVITNACNLSCGGCCQLVGQFRKDQIWFISLDELERNISILKKYPPEHGELSPITIFGGEPTLHPRWDNIIKILKRNSPTVFRINTNGRLGHQRYQKEDNIVWYVDLHPESQLFVQSSYAAMDAIRLPDDIDYWRKAQKDCPIWNGCQCSIYNGKAYFCENAAAIDWLHNNGNNGWSISEDANPFDRTNQEIDKQAAELCKRCGWCIPEIVPRQLSIEPTYVSRSNQITKGRNLLPVIDIQSVQRWDQKKQYHDFDLAIFIISDKPIENEKDLIDHGVNVYYEKDEQVAFERGISEHEWSIILAENHLIPKNSLNAIINWICKEKYNPNQRLNFSIPVYEASRELVNQEIPEPSLIQTVSDGICKNSVNSIVIAFHKNSRENRDDGILDRLGHRKTGEGSGVASLWHDKLTDIVGGIIKNCVTHVI